MNHRAAIFLITSLLIGGGCTSKSREEALKDETFSLMKEMNGILEGVKDVNSARAARPRLEVLGTKLKALQAEFATVKEPSPEVMAAYLKELQPIQEKLMGHMMRIGLQAEVGAELEGAFDGPGGAARPGRTPPAPGAQSPGLPELVEQARRKSEGAPAKGAGSAAVAAVYGDLDKNGAVIKDASRPKQERLEALMKVHLSTLGSPGDQKAVEYLSAGLDAKEREVKNAALTVLSQRGRSAGPAVPKIIVLLDDPDCQIAAIAALGAIGPPAKDALPKLEKLAASGSTAAKSLAGDAMAKIRAAQ